MSLLARMGGVAALSLGASLSGCAGSTAADPILGSATHAGALGEADPTTREAAAPTSSASVASRQADVDPLPSPIALHPPTHEDLGAYTWLDGSSSIRSLRVAFPTPSGFERVSEQDGSFGAWLRTIPLRAPFTPVKTFSGSILRQSDDARISAVAELDIGKSDLQQCADSVIRLHAEWLWARGETREIGYHFLSGELVTWQRYARGERPSVDGAKVVWKTSAKPDESRATFRKYLDVVFMYASTISLAQHSEVVAKADVQPGDFFILPGGPGHAVLILDIAKSPEGKKIALLGQGYMPAQDFQVLHPDGPSAWFSLDADAVDTPFWVPFPWSALHRFAEGANKP